MFDSAVYSEHELLECECKGIGEVRTVCFPCYVDCLTYLSCTISLLQVYHRYLLIGRREDRNQLLDSLLGDPVSWVGALVPVVKVIRLLQQ